MDEKEQVDRREMERNRFRIDTTVNLAHILTTVALVVSIASWGSDLKATVLKHDGEIADLRGVKVASPRANELNPSFSHHSSVVIPHRRRCV